MSTSFAAAPLELIDQMVQESTGQPLTKLQRLVLEECWGTEKKTYEEIATENNYSSGYIQQRIAPGLWQILSKLVGTKVNKSNIREVLTKYLETVAETDAVDSSGLIEPLVLSAPSASAPPVEPTVSLVEPLPGESGESIEFIESVERLESVSEDELEHAPDYSRTSVGQDLELPMGSVPLSSPYYVRRDPDEATCYQKIVQPGALIRIRAPRQMGKTSLARRIFDHAEGFCSVMITCQESDRSTLSDLDKFLRWFCTNLSLQLKLTPALDDFWDEDVGSKMSCTLYVEGYILRLVDTPIVLAVDEASDLFEHPDIAQDFFTMLRSWHEYTKYDETWARLRLILVLSTENYLPLNINQSPFNVGTEVALGAFSHEQVVTLGERHGLSLDPDAYDQLMVLLGGHPYLIRLALYHLAKGTVNWDQMLATAATDEGIFSDHLHRHLWNLQRYRDLGTAFQKVLDQGGLASLNQMQGFKLASMGVVTLQKNQVRVSCDLYQQYFSKRLPITLL